MIEVYICHTKCAVYDMYQSLIAIIAVNDGGLYMSYKIAHFMIAITSVNNRRICYRKLF